MAMLGIGDYLCEACKHFDTDGNDGNHPFCRKQGGMGMGESNKAVRLGEDCPFGYEFGVPSGYPVSMKRNEERAYEIKAMNGKHAGVVQEYYSSGFSMTKNGGDVCPRCAEAFGKWWNKKRKDDAE